MGVFCVPGQLRGIRKLLMTAGPTGVRVRRGRVGGPYARIVGDSHPPHPMMVDGHHGHPRPRRAGVLGACAHGGMQYRRGWDFVWCRP